MTILPWRSRHTRTERLTAAGTTHGLVLAAVLLPFACGPISDSPDAAGAVVETETIGDTTVVRTVSGSAWGGDATLVPETSIGEMEGPEEYLFGSVRAIAVDDDHNVYVLDGQARHVRVFDSAGTYVNTFGGGGEGPGEFRVPIGVAVSNGRVLVRDPANGRVQLFVLETGEAEEWRYGANPIFMNTPLYKDDQGRIYVDNSDEEQRFIVMGPDGTHLDTISAPEAPADFDDDRYSMSVEAESGERVDLGRRDRSVRPGLVLDGPPFRPFRDGPVHSLPNQS